MAEAPTPGVPSDGAVALARRISGAFIDGRPVTGDGEPLTVFDPAAEAPVAVVAECSGALVDAAVRSAGEAFADGRWSGLRPADRERILLKFADLVEAEAEFLAEVESWNQGKSINIARAVDAGAAVEFMRYFAGLATKITGHTLDVSITMPPGARHNAYTRREPLGVVAAIAPWNFPMLIAVWKVMPALAAGCTVVLKPSELTPLTSFRLVELALEAGVPPGAFNLVNGRGATTGNALVSHPGVAKISFTGSTAAGKAIAHVAADRLARVTLELGGKNPAIVLRDADLSKVVPGLLMGALMNGGQVCAAASRVYCERGLCDALTGALAEATSSMTFGAGLDPSAQVTPLVSDAHRQRVLGHLERARATGATILSGGAPPDRGYFVSPTLVVGKPEAAIHREEVFGPVLGIVPVDGPEEAIRLANDTDYGLAASIWTESLSQAMRLASQVRAGTVWVNNHVPVDPNLPFGGFGQSGLGRDFGPNALDAYTELKSVCITY